MGRIRTEKKYLAYFKYYGDGYDVVFPDLPDCVATGKTFDEAAINAGVQMYLYLVRYFVLNGTYPKKTYWRHRPPEPEDVFSCYIVRYITPLDHEHERKLIQQEEDRKEAERQRIEALRHRNPWH